MQIDNPKISIVTPSFNQGQYVEEMIQSVLSQDYKNFEHIIIDGGSTDKTLEILKKYPHLIWVSEPDNGQSDALNKGFERAKGEWILWLNADDILLPNALQKYRKEIIKNPNADVIHGHMQFFMDGIDEITKKQYFTNFSRLKTLFGVVVPPTTGTLFNKKVLLRNPLSTDFHYMMDAEWYIRCGKNLNVVIIDHFLVKFRISDFNKTSDQILKRILNKQQLKERQLLYDTYVLPLIINVPKGVRKYYYTMIRFFLLNVNRVWKLKYYI